MEPAPQRRPRIVEEPKRTPWPLILGVALAAIAAGSLIWQAVSDLRFSIGRDAVADEDLLEVREPTPPAGEQETFEPGDTTPRWVSQPAGKYPRSGYAVSSARVSLTCTIQTDHRLGGCVITEETPAGYGFGQSAVAAAEEARVSTNSIPGETVSFSIGYRLPD